jgi:hypothetical protein
MPQPATDAKMRATEIPSSAVCSSARARPPAALQQQYIDDKSLVKKNNP